MDKPPIKRNPEMIIALSALFVGVVTVVIGAYSAWVDRAYARASVWPRVEMGRSYNQSGYRYLVGNRGTGPAVVHHARVSIDGEPVRDWGALMAALDLPKFHYTQSHIGNRVIAAGDTVTVLDTDQPELAAALVAAESRNLALELCYCSIYDQCWWVDANNDPRETPACSLAEAQRFRQ